MELTLREHAVRIQIIELSGRLEAFTVARMREVKEKLIDIPEKNFIVDLRQVSFMDSAGLASLISLLKHARQFKGDTVLVKPTDPAAYRILSLTRFDQVFTLYDTVEQAIAHF